MEPKKDPVIILSENEKAFYSKLFNKFASEVNNEKVCIRRSFYLIQ